MPARWTLGEFTTPRAVSTPSRLRHLQATDAESNPRASHQHLFALRPTRHDAEGAMTPAGEALRLWQADQWRRAALHCLAARSTEQGRAYKVVAAHQPLRRLSPLPCYC